MHIVSAHPAWPDTVPLDTYDLIGGLDSALRKVRDVVNTGQHIALSHPIAFGHNAAFDAAAIRVLAEATANFVPVDWILAAPLPWPLRSVAHLRPPRKGLAEATEDAYAWAQRYKIGICVYRVGPSFVSIRDVRSHGSKTSIVIPRDWKTAFLELAATTEQPRRGRTRDLFGQLVSMQLALPFADTHFALLPYRAQRTPVLPDGLAAVI